MVKNLWVVIPEWNEVNGIVSTLDALRTQSDTSFSLVVVDNDSTDGTSRLVTDYIAQYGLVRWEVIGETQRGTGAASDTGMRYAIAKGAEELVRTDADCIPVVDWIKEMRLEFDRGTQLVSGKCGPRVDEKPRSAFTLKMLDGVVSLAEVYGKFRFSNRGQGYKAPFMMLSGCNVGITTETYVESGGFMRTKIEDVHEDRELMNSVRLVTDKIVFSHKAFVHMSTRRVDAWGIVNTLRWYRNHGYKPENVNIR